jgi:hypothetical protein
VVRENLHQIQSNLQRLDPLFSKMVITYHAEAFWDLSFFSEEFFPKMKCPRNRVERSMACKDWWSGSLGSQGIIVHMATAPGNNVA